jgi:hypothetical protein
MHKDIQAHFKKLEDAVQATAVPADRKEFIAVSVEKISVLYTKYRETNESRYGDEITRLVQWVLQELQACPEARKLDADFREGLRLLHEQLGVPGLMLKPPAPPPRSPKPRKK